MEFRDVVRRRRMIRDFVPRPVPRPVLDRVLETALHAPSAGFAQGLELVVLDEEHDLERFWRITDPRARKRGRTEGGPPVVVLAVANRNAYLERYSEPDKRGLGMDSEEGWPVPYWDLDAAMSVMLMLLAAVDEGLIGKDHVRAEIGEVVAGTAPGRTSAQEITLYKSVGVAVQDAAAAALVLEAARRKGTGTDVPL